MDLNEHKAKKIVIDTDENDSFVAVNYDGSVPEIVSNTIIIKELWCPGDCGCGGCQSIFRQYKIGATKESGKRFYWKKI